MGVETRVSCPQSSPEKFRRIKGKGVSGARLPHSSSSLGRRGRAHAIIRGTSAGATICKHKSQQYQRDACHVRRRYAPSNRSKPKQQQGGRGQSRIPAIRRPAGKPTSSPLGWCLPVPMAFRNIPSPDFWRLGNFGDADLRVWHAPPCGCLCPCGTSFPIRF